MEPTLLNAISMLCPSYNRLRETPIPAGVFECGPLSVTYASPQRSIEDIE